MKNDYKFQNVNNSLGISICQLCIVSIHSLFYIHHSTHTHKNIHTYVYIHICVHYTYMHACTNIPIHIFLYVGECAHVVEYMHNHMITLHILGICMHIWKHSYIDKIYTCMHTYSLIHKQYMQVLTYIHYKQ